MAQIIVREIPLQNITMTVTAVSVPPELGVTLSEAQNSRDAALLAAANAATSETNAATSAAEALVSRNEAEAFRNEAEGFRDQAQAVVSGDYQTSSQVQATLDAGYYTQTEVNNLLSPYVDVPELNLALAGYVTDAELTTALSPYVTSTGLTTALGGYYTTTEVDALVGAIDTSNYYTQAQTDTAISTALTGYDTSTTVDSKIATATSGIDLTGYYTSVETDAAITAALVPYDTSVEVDAKLAAIDLSSYYTSTETDAAITLALGDYDTSLSVDGKIATALTGYATEAWVTGQLANYSTTEYIEDNFLPKSGISSMQSTLRSQRGLFGEDAVGIGVGWGSAIWTKSQSQFNQIAGTSYNPTTTQTGISWLQNDNAQVDGDVGEGMYIYKNGTLLAGIGETGILALGDIAAFSDQRLKSDFQAIEHPLSKLHSLFGTNYHRDDLEIRQDGLIAQDVQAALPDSVKRTQTGHLAVNYNGVVALLVEAVKELSVKVTRLEMERNS